MHACILVNYQCSVVYISLAYVVVNSLNSAWVLVLVAVWLSATYKGGRTGGGGGGGLKISENVTKTS